VVQGRSSFFDVGGKGRNEKLEGRTRNGKVEGYIGISIFFATGEKSSRQDRDRLPLVAREAFQ